MIPSCTGTASVAITVSISSFRPRNSSFANANPARALKSTTEAVTTEATMNEFVRPFAKSTFTMPALNSR